MARFVFSGVLIAFLLVFGGAGCHVPQRFQEAPEENAPSVPDAVPEAVVEVEASPTAAPVPEVVETPPEPVVEAEEPVMAVTEEETEETGGWDTIRAGMSLAEVEVRIGKAQTEVMRSAESVTYRWNHPEREATGLGKVNQDGMLVLWRVRDKVKAPPKPAPSIAVEAALSPPAIRTAVPAPQVEVPVEEEVVVPELVAAARPRVVVAGASRRAREDGTATGEGSYRPKARLPEFTYGLTDDSYRFHFVNGSGSLVRLGIRTEKEGKDISLAVGETRKIRVERGVFQIYFIFDDAPYALHQSAAIVLDQDAVLEQFFRIESDQYTLNGIAEALWQ